MEGMRIPATLLVLLLAGAPAAAQETFTLEGEAALLTVAIRPDKTADFEQVLSRLHDALRKSDKPERQRQAEGWKVVRLSTPLPDGNIAYVHVVSPVVPNADYSIMQILYDAFPDERQQLYDLYRGAFVRNLSLASGDLIADMSKASAAAPRPAAPTPPSPASPAPPSPTSPTPPTPPTSPAPPPPPVPPTQPPL